MLEEFVASRMPRLSLTVLKLSRSRKSTATSASLRSLRAMAWLRRSWNRFPFGKTGERVVKSQMGEIVSRGASVR